MDSQRADDFAADIRTVNVDGVDVRLYIAGSFVSRQGGKWRVREVVGSCSAVLVDYDNLTLDAMGDVACAFAIGSRVVLCGESDSGPAGFFHVAAALFGEPMESCIELAAALVYHDPRREITSGTPWAGEWLRALSRCESAAERRLCIHLLDMVTMEHRLTPQKQVCTPSGNYRLDFAITDVLAEDGEESSYNIAVEVDGHDFHERTKEQAKHDKSRDRALTAAGWRVLRFTGSEVWNDPSKCAREVYELANGLASKDYEEDE